MNLTSIWIVLFTLISIIESVDYYLLVNDDCSKRLITMFTLTEWEELIGNESLTIINCQLLKLVKENSPLCSYIDVESYPILIAYSDNKYYMYKSLLENQYELINLVSSDDLRYFGLVDIINTHNKERETFAYLTIIQVWIIIKLIVYIIL